MLTCCAPESRNSASLSLSLHPGNTERPGDESFTTSEALGGLTRSDRAPHPPALTIHPTPPPIQLPTQPDLSPGAQPPPAPEAHPAWPSRGAGAAQSRMPISTPHLCPLRVSVSPWVSLALTFPASPSLSPPAPTLHWACDVTTWGPGTPPPHRCPGTGVRLFWELAAPLGLSQQFWQAHLRGSARAGRGRGVWPRQGCGERAVETPTSAVPGRGTGWVFPAVQAQSCPERALGRGQPQTSSVPGI